MTANEDVKPAEAAASTASINVIVIEDQRDIREGLRVLINGSPGYSCRGAYRSVEEVLAQKGKDDADVLLVDIGLPGMSGIEGLPLLLRQHPESVIVMLTIYDDDDRVFEAICAGASGYLLKKTPPARLLDSLREAVNGGAPMSPQVARRVIELFRQVGPRDTASHDLTPHELRLLGLLAEGHNYKTAA